MIRKIVDKISPCIIHSHIALPWGYIFRAKGNAKKIITVHGSDVYPKKRYPRRYFLDAALGNCDAVICPSKWLSEYVSENYHVRPVVIPNGVNTQTFQPPHTNQNIPGVILYVGRFIKRKGIAELVKVAQALPEYEFWLVGGRLEDGQVNAFPSNAKILPFERDMVSLYAKASLCVFPSHWENFPVVGLEAMACGKAVVATESGFSEYIDSGQDGVLVKPRDVKALTESVEYLMEDHNTRRRIEKNARKKALRYDWNIIADRHREFYDRL